MQMETQAGSTPNPPHQKRSRYYSLTATAPDNSKLLNATALSVPYTRNNRYHDQGFLSGWGRYCVSSYTRISHPLAEQYQHLQAPFCPHGTLRINTGQVELAFNALGEHKVARSYVCIVNNALRARTM